MEDILASIKRIIADDGAAVAPPRARRAAPDPVPDPAPVVSSAKPSTAAAQADAGGILELTDPVEAAPADPATLLSAGSATASRQSLDALSAMVVRSGGAGGCDNTLEALVRDLLRPVLKEWLDARLPGMVEAMVAREIARITGRTL